MDIGMNLYNVNLLIKEFITTGYKHCYYTPCERKKCQCCNHNDGEGDIDTTNHVSKPRPKLEPKLNYIYVFRKDVYEIDDDAISDIRMMSDRKVIYLFTTSINANDVNEAGATSAPIKGWDKYIKIYGARDEILREVKDAAVESNGRDYYCYDYDLYGLVSRINCELVQF